MNPPVDFLSVDFARYPHPHYRRLQKDAPVWWDEPSRSWYITAYHDVRSLLRDPRLSARIGSGFFGELESRARTEASDVVDFFESWPMFTDPPVHTVMRSAAQPHYRPAAASSVRPWVRGLAVDLLAGLPSGRQDLLAGFVQPLSTAVTCGLLGIEEQYRQRVLSWSNDIIAFIGVPQIDLSRVPEARAAMAQLEEYVRTVTIPMARRGQGPEQIKAFLELEPRQATALFAQLVTGGIEPVVACLTSALVSLLGEAGDVQEDLSAGRVGAAEVAEEALRHEAPFHYVPRSVVEPIELRGQVLRPGERVALVVAAANRDPDVFDEPTRFRVDRVGASSHLAFGAGHHFCLGAGVSRVVLTEGIGAFGSWAAGRRRVTWDAQREAAFGHTVWRRVALWN